MNTQRIKVFSAMRMVRVLALQAVVCSAIASPPAARASLIMLVDTTGDSSNPGDTTCSLREAIQAANTNSVVDQCDGTTTDTIGFNIGGGGAQTIDLVSSLDITTPVILDGTTQPGYAGIPLIHITGDDAAERINLSGTAHGSIIRALRFSQTQAGGGTPAAAMTIDADNIQIKGCYFNTNGTYDIAGNSSGVVFLDTNNSTVGGPLPADRNVFGGDEGISLATGTGNTIQNNYFGVKASDGNTELAGMAGGGAGIKIYAASGVSSGNTIRDNVIAKYNLGILLGKLTTLNTIAGNKIGVAADGTTALGNGIGVFLEGSSNNTIGGTTAADRNVISASTGVANFVLAASVSPSGTSSGNTIQGNYIGTTADGLTGLSASVHGLQITAGNNNVIGGTAPGAGNVISGNDHGVIIYAGNSGTIIRGNKIGTDPGGMTAVGNGSAGLALLAPANVGDATTPGNNIIGANASWGIVMESASGTTIYGNRIGVNALGSAGIPNSSGVAVENGSSATIGGNWIAFNTGDGIDIDSTSSVLASSQNCFNSNTPNAVRNSHTGVTAPFTSNWWGHDTGPSGSGPGTGDAVTDDVDYSGYLTLPAAVCHIFADVPTAGKEWMEPWVDTFYMHGITTGCGANPLTYCPENAVTRAAMAVFILRAIEGPSYVPPAATHTFSDLPVTGKEWMEPWVDEFYDRGITTGCGTDPLRYCPENPVTRAAMAVFLLRAKNGAAYVPDPLSHYFSDMPVTGKEWMEPWVDQFYRLNITTGCGADPLTYCPENPVTRAAMAVFIGRVYDLYP